MEETNFVNSVFNYLLLALVPCYMFSIGYAMKVHKRIANQLPIIWCLTFFFPPMIVVAVYDTSSRVKSFFKKKKIPCDSDYGWILAGLTVLSFVAFLAGAGFFFSKIEPSINDFYVFAILSIASLMLQTLGSAYSIYTFRQILKVHEEWKISKSKKS